MAKSKKGIVLDLSLVGARKLINSARVDLISKQRNVEVLSLDNIEDAQKELAEAEGIFAKFTRSINQYSDAVSLLLEIIESKAQIKRVLDNIKKSVAALEAAYAAEQDRYPARATSADAVSIELTLSQMAMLSQMDETDPVIDEVTLLPPEPEQASLQSVRSAPAVVRQAQAAPSSPVTSSGNAACILAAMEIDETDSMHVSDAVPLLPPEQAALQSVRSAPAVVLQAQAAPPVNRALAFDAVPPSPVTSSGNAAYILAAMEAAIEARSYWTHGKSEKVHQLTKLRDDYQSADSRGEVAQNILKDFIILAATPRRVKIDNYSFFGRHTHFTAAMGDTVSAKAFYKALTNDAAREQVTSALGGTGSLPTPTEKNHCEFAKLVMVVSPPETSVEGPHTPR